MKIIIVGINHAGTSALRTLLAQKGSYEITAYDRNDNISFLGCGIALTVGGTVKDLNSLFYCTPKWLSERGATVKMKHDVIDIDNDNKKVQVKNLETGEVFSDDYDKLIYAAGSWPIDIPGIPEENANLENIEICKLFQHAEILVNKANSDDIKNVAVIGGGYIGIELAEAYHLKGKNVTLIDFENRVLPKYFDIEFTGKLQGCMREKGITLALGEKVVDFKGSGGKVKKVITDKGEYVADLVIKCIGFKPNTELLPNADKIKNGALIVNKYMQTNLADIYAVGDTVAIYHMAWGNYQQVALATNAVKTGIVAACSIAGNDNIKLDSVVGTNAICVFGNKLSATGISEEAARCLGLDVAVSYVKDNDKPEFMDKYDEVAIKLIYDKKDLRLLGAQIGSWGDENHTEAIFYLALAIQKNMTLPELAFTDVYFLPHFNKPFNFVLTAVMQALGLNYV